MNVRYDFEQLRPILADAIAQLSPEDRAEREKSPGITMYAEARGWYRFDWAGRFLARVHRSRLLSRDTPSLN